MNYTFPSLRQYCLSLPIYTVSKLKCDKGPSPFPRAIRALCLCMFDRMKEGGDQRLTQISALVNLVLEGVDGDPL